MFNLILTLLRGRAHEAEQAIADRNAVPLLAQQIRDASLAIQSTRRAVAVAIAQNAQEKKQHATIVGHIANLETRTLAALQKGDTLLAREAAETIAHLETERDASTAAQAQFSAAIDKVKDTLRAAEARFHDLQRGERLARATEEVQKLGRIHTGRRLDTLADAEQTLSRLRTRQAQNEVTAATLQELEGLAPEHVIEKLANAGCGTPLRTSADDVLSRLRNQMNTAA